MVGVGPEARAHRMLCLLAVVAVAQQRQVRGTLQTARWQNASCTRALRSLDVVKRASAPPTCKKSLRPCSTRAMSATAASYASSTPCTETRTALGG